MWLKILTFVIVAVAIAYGLRAIRRNINDYFADVDKDKLKRDREDRRRSDIVDLKRDPKDGVFRPGDNKKDDDKDA
ncbi:hypothetical protein [Maritalea porphyrae]|uniref:DUF2897 family protein n=1 Tax=Maritalea porphyrae TaxID=880732 RepID=A0ABQ5URC7_9HYPH|nr:hypothetical protein [Maritalea porphyrae]GLQ17820.1 hypothetical protein GCM10007879_20690 [Maritalea porphyrae]